MRPGLTPKMAECLDAIARLTVNNVPPSYDELADALGLASKSGVLRMLTELKARGYVAWHPVHARSLHIIGANADAYTPAALHTLSPGQLRALMAHATGILAHKTSDAETEAVLRRLADRISHKPKDQAA